MVPQGVFEHQHVQLANELIVFVGWQVETD
jgi:hypothetical protein